MFGLNRKMLTETPTSPQSRSYPRPRLVKKNETLLDDYETLSKEIDFAPAQLLQEQLIRFLAENQIPVYDYQEVYDYLKRKARAAGKIWIWRPLRAKDQIQEWNWRSDDGEEFYGHGSYWGSQPAWRAYDKAVPIHILRQVKLIDEHFKDRVRFFVSDYTVLNPDPFVMVTAFDMDRIIFGAWDEPGFFEKTG